MNLIKSPKTLFTLTAVLDRVFKDIFKYCC